MIDNGIITIMNDEHARLTADLTPQQILFCKYYTTKGDTFSNGYLSYGLAFDYKLDELSRQREVDEKGNEIKGTSEFERAMSTCAVGASRLLINNKIIAYKTKLMVDLFNDDNVFDSRLSDIAIKGKDTDSIQAIKHRNDLKQRITKKVDITTANRPLANLSDEDLLKLAQD